MKRYDDQAIIAFLFAIILVIIGGVGNITSMEFFILPILLTGAGVVLLLLGRPKEAKKA